MEPITGLVVYLVLASLVSLVASKKGRSGVLFFVSQIVLPIPVIIATSAGMGSSPDKGVVMAGAAFMVPIISFLVALMSNTAEQEAATRGEFGDYKKCPFCAESVRREAMKCKHCQSDLSGTAAPKP